MAYPGDPYFDSARPSWMPYWLDTTTETQAKYAWLMSGGKVTPKQVVNPGAVYPVPPTPPAVKPPANIVTPPAAGADAQATVDAILARQMREWQGQNQQFFTDLSKQLAVTDTRDNWALWAAAAGAAALLILILTRR